MCSDMNNSIGFESKYIDNISGKSHKLHVRPLTPLVSVRLQKKEERRRKKKGESKNEENKEKDLAACKFLKLLDFASRLLIW